MSTRTFSHFWTPDFFHYRQRGLQKIVFFGPKILQLFPPGRELTQQREALGSSYCTLKTFKWVEKKLLPFLKSSFTYLLSWRFHSIFIVNAICDIQLICCMAFLFQNISILLSRLSNMYCWHFMKKWFKYSAAFIPSVYCRNKGWMKQTNEDNFSECIQRK